MEIKDIVNTVICGDCLEVMKRLPDKCVDLVLTDPPYGIDIQKTGSGLTGRKGFVYGGDFTQNGGAIIEGDREPDGRFLSECFRVLKDNTALYMFSRWDVDDFWIKAIRDAGFTVKNRIIWAKHTGGSGDLDASFMPSHETLWFANKGRAIRKGKRYKDVWYDNWTECVRHGKVHPFEKPVDILERCIIQSSSEGELILDCFSGSGTTAVACIRTKRNYILIEKEPKYVDICRARIAQAETGVTVKEQKAGQGALW
jgi:site-specific DNA-methyltransferase (adenine-specific)